MGTTNPFCILFSFVWQKDFIVRKFQGRLFNFFIVVDSGFNVKSRVNFAGYMRRNHCRNVPSQPGNFLHHTAGNIGIMLRSHQATYFYIRVQVAVILSKLQFIIKITDSSQASNNYSGTNVLCIMCGKLFVFINPYIGNIFRASLIISTRSSVLKSNFLAGAS